MRAASSVAHFARDAALRQILPDAAAVRAVLARQVPGAGGDRRGRSPPRRGAAAPGEGRVAGEPGGEGGEDPGATPYHRSVGPMCAVALDLPDAHRAISDAPPIASLGMVSALDEAVHGVLHEGAGAGGFADRGAVQLESGSPAVVIAALGADEAGAAETAVELASRLSAALPGAVRASTGRDVAFRCVVVTSDAVVAVAGHGRPALRVLGPVQLAQALLPVAARSQVFVDTRTFHCLPVPLQRRFHEQSFFVKGSKEPTIMAGAAPRQLAEFLATHPRAPSPLSSPRHAAAPRNPTDSRRGERVVPVSPDMSP